MRRLVLASGNQKKLLEINSIMQPFGFELLKQGELGVSEAEETGTTFVENAIIKARNAAQHTGLPAVADDSGIEVDYLNGAPGIYSARFSGKDATDDSNNALLVEKLTGTEPHERSARYRAVIVFMAHAADASPIICEGSWEGQIILQPRGKGGFGYDPYFYLPGLKCTAAELPADHKNRISHRGQALKHLKQRLELLVAH